MGKEISEAADKTKFVLRHAGKIVLCSDGEGLRLPSVIPVGCTVDTQCFTLQEGGEHFIGYNVADGNLPQGYVAENLRAAYARLGEREYHAAGKLMELLHWEEGCRYCGHCGAPMLRSTEISMKCSRCSREVFAPVSPAIIVLVTRGEEALLVHARNFTRPYFGLVAGFVETGESLEECVAREVKEETSLNVKNVLYAGSQPWPYPNSLMIGFTAEYDSGTLCFADGELTEGGFFTADNLPLLPPKPSIARSLIEQWIGGVSK